MDSEPVPRIGPRFFGLERELSEVLGLKADPNTPDFSSRYFRDEVLAEADDNDIFDHKGPARATAFAAACISASVADP